MLSQSHSFLLSSLGFLILRGISAQYNSQAKPEDPIRSGLFNAQVKFRAEPRHVSTQRPVSSSSLLCCQDFDREIEPRISCTCRYLYDVFLNWISECRFWRAAMGSAFPTSHSSDHLERWRKYLSNWKCKEILKELDWGVQLQGFEGSVEASGEGVLRNWASQRLYWALDPVDRYTAGFVMAVPYGCDGNGRCNIGNWFKGKKTKKTPSFLRFSGCKNTAVFGFLNWLHIRPPPILFSSLLPCWHCWRTRKHSLIVLALYMSFCWGEKLTQHQLEAAPPEESKTFNASM